MLIALDAKNALVASAFSRLGTVRILETAEITRSSIKDADALIVRSETLVNAELLEGTSVRFVGTATIGTDHVDLDYLRSAGIGFASAPGSNANSVAEYVAEAFCLIAERLGRDLTDLSVGIVGVGNVGSRVEKVAQAIGMRVVLNDPPLARTTRDHRFTSLDEIMDADIVSLHVPLTRSGEDATYHLFDAPRIARMKPRSVLINTARGAVVDSPVLLRALEEHRLSAAVLDVWENEPSIDTSLLARTLLATPHIAGYSLDGKINAARMMYDALCRYLGSEMAWEYSERLPGPEQPVVHLPPQLNSLREAVQFAALKGYDILHDDAQLRRLPLLPPAQQPAYFRKLRSEYPVRREFMNYEVQLGSPGTRLRGTLQALGFRVS